MNFGSFKNVDYKLLVYKSYIFIYVYKQDLPLNNPQGLLCYNAQSTKSNVNDDLIL